MLLACRVGNIVASPRFDTFVHTRYGMWIPSGSRIELAILHAESQCSMFLSYKLDWRWILGLIWLNYIHCQYFVDLMFFETCSRTGYVWLWINPSSAVKLFQFDFSPPWFGLSVPLVYLEAWTELIRVWANERWNCLIFVPCYANGFLPCRFVPLVLYAGPPDPPSVLVVCNVHC